MNSIKIKFSKDDIERIKKLADDFLSYYEMETWSIQDVNDMLEIGKNV